MTTGYTAITFLKTNYSPTKETMTLLECHYSKGECFSHWHRKKNGGVKV